MGINRTLLYFLVAITLTLVIIDTLVYRRMDGHRALGEENRKLILENRQLIEELHGHERNRTD